MLYIVLFLHQTTTGQGECCYLEGCISYYSYIKPQPNYESSRIRAVVYRTIPTSNHNPDVQRGQPYLLYIVLFLHQTTTELSILEHSSLLYIVLFLHQTTTTNWRDIFRKGCISYYSYIKPQLSSK